MIDPYTLAVEVMDSSGVTLGIRPLDPDWEPAEEALRFAAIRSERMQPSAVPPEARVMPVWDRRIAAVNGVRVPSLGG